MAVLFAWLTVVSRIGELVSSIIEIAAFGAFTGEKGPQPLEFRARILAITM